MKGKIFFLNKSTNELTMQINFHSLWSYLPRVLIFLVMTVYINIYIRAVTIHQTHDSVRITIFDHDSVRITIFSWGVGEKKEDF